MIAALEVWLSPAVQSSDRGVDSDVSDSSQRTPRLHRAGMPKRRHRRRVISHVKSPGWDRVAHDTPLESGGEQSKTYLLVKATNSSSVEFWILEPLDGRDDDAGLALGSTKQRALGRVNGVHHAARFQPYTLGCRSTGPYPV